jgi:hypothetical protein
MLCSIFLPSRKSVMRDFSSINIDVIYLNAYAHCDLHNTYVLPLLEIYFLFVMICKICTVPLWMTATVRGRSYYGGPEYICGSCNALYWFQERSKGAHDGRLNLPVYNGCCCAGKVSLPKFPDWPFPLKDLLTFDGDDASSTFLRLIRHYNSMFCFTSLGAHVDESVNMGNGPYVFKMGGSVYHRIGSLIPADDETPKFAQLYIVDSADELDCRFNAFEEEGGAPSQADPFVVLALIEMLDEHNQYVQLYRTARQRLQSADAPNLAIQFFGHEGAAHGDRYSGPTVPEVAALIVGEFTPQCHKFDVIAEATSGQLEHISYLNPSLMPLQYPLLFPFGDPSFHVGIEYQQRRAAGRRRCRTSRQTPSSSSRKHVTMLQYYAYYFHYRPNEPNPYTCCGRLSQQAAVNCYSCVEASRLSYHFLKQDELRSETYQGITDAMGEGSTTGKNLGVQIMLHSSFTAGPRYFVQNYHDGMAICREYGAPDLFITFTCNPKWEEIRDMLSYENGQLHTDRPDLVTRVFNMKFDDFLTDMKSGELFGPIQACKLTTYQTSILISLVVFLFITFKFFPLRFPDLYVVEFQKRGLPHTHTLIWLKGDTQQPSASFIDSLISAEIPDPMVDPLGYALVDEFMVHGPCGEHNVRCPCMKNGSCSKWFPKEFNDETLVDEKGFPVYRRRNLGHFVVRNRGSVKLDNRWVVPYNMQLLKRFQAHINVEWCNKTNLLKYLFKYLTKGHDVARVRFQHMFQCKSFIPPGEPTGRNEILEFIQCRYYSFFPSKFVHVFSLYQKIKNTIRSLLSVT